MPDPTDTNTEHATTASSPSGKRRVLTITVQVLGFAIGIAAMVWVLSEALKPENREQLKKLADASAMQLFGLFALTAASLCLNGLMFWVLLWPVRRLRVLDVIAVNSLATGLSYLPFKLSMVVRITIHRVRDGVPLATIGAWMIATLGSLGATLGPIVLASLWRKGIDAWWIGTVVVGVIGANTLVILAGRLLEGERGLSRIRTMLELANLGRLCESERFSQAHLGLSMVAKFEAIGGAVVFRLLDLTVQAGRFLIAAAVLGVELSFSDAILLGGSFFLIGALSPSGEAGLREAGTIKIAALFGIAAAAAEGSGDASANPIVIITLFVAGAESVVRLIAAGFSVVWLRADRLITASGRAQLNEASRANPVPSPPTVADEDLAGAAESDSR